jgi:hypothetical protein
MKYSVLHITNLYDTFLLDYYAVNSTIIRQPYELQYQHLLECSIEVNTLLLRRLNQLGVQTRSIIANSKPLQAAWRGEHPQTSSGGSLIFKQIAHYQPDVLWIDHLPLMSHGLISTIRRTHPEIKLIFGQICAPFSSHRIKDFLGFDFMITCTPCLQRELAAQGIRSYCIYHSFEPEILDRLAALPNEPIFDLTFSGSLYTGPGYHEERIFLLEKILKAGLPLEVFANLQSPIKTIGKEVQKLYKYAIGCLSGSGRVRDVSLPRLKFSAYSPTLLSAVRPPVFGSNLLALLRRSRISLNLHGAIAGTCAGNLRLFEATGMGSCLVTDHKENISELFDPDYQIVTYKSTEECVEKLLWLLNSPESVDSIARAGQARTLSQHTSSLRARQLDLILTDNLHRVTT